MAASNSPGPEPLWTRLDNLYDTRLAREIPQYIQPELYHYTDVDGLKGIVESNTLWATSAYHLNDSSEIEYGCQLVVDCIDEWLKANPELTHDAPSIPLHVFNLLKASFKEPSSRAGRHVSIYVTCFCEDGNLLSQWRAYGQRGGYSIGMVSSDLELGIAAPGFFATRLQRVIYNRTAQRERIHALLKDFAEIVEDGRLYRLPAANEQAFIDLMTDLSIYLQELVMDEVVAFKNPAFAEEREWRIVARPRLVEMKRAREQGHIPPPAGAASDIQYRSSRGVVVPYVKLSPIDGEDKIPIYSLRLGPSIDKNRTEYALYGFLLKHGYKSVSVVGSDLPVIL